MLIGRLSKSAGSTTASHNRFGAYLRNRVIPTNPTTSFQTAVRGDFSDNTTAWKALTDVQRAAWTALGANFIRTDSLGEPYSLTGLQAYISVNQNLDTVGSSNVSDAPGLNIPDVPAAGTIAATTADTIALTYTPPSAGDFVLLTMTRPLSPGINFEPRSAFKLIAVLDSLDTSPFAAGAAYVARFGTLAGKAGQKILFRLASVNAAGFKSTELQASSIIAAP